MKLPRRLESGATERPRGRGKPEPKKRRRRDGLSVGDCLIDHYAHVQSEKRLRTHHTRQSSNSNHRIVKALHTQPVILICPIRSQMLLTSDVYGMATRSSGIRWQVRLDEAAYKGGWKVYMVFQCIGVPIGMSVCCWAAYNGRAAVLWRGSRPHFMSTEKAAWHRFIQTRRMRPLSHSTLYRDGMLRPERRKQVLYNVALARFHFIARWRCPPLTCQPHSSLSPCPPASAPHRAVRSSPSPPPCVPPWHVAHI